MYPIFKAVQAALPSPPGEAFLRGYVFIPGGESLRDDRKEYLVKKKRNSNFNELHGDLRFLCRKLNTISPTLHCTVEYAEA